MDMMLQMLISRHEEKIKELVAGACAAKDEADDCKRVLTLFDRCSSTQIDVPEVSMVRGFLVCDRDCTTWYYGLGTNRRRALVLSNSCKTDLFQQKQDSSIAYTILAGAWSIRMRSCLLASMTEEQRSERFESQGEAGRIHCVQMVLLMMLQRELPDHGLSSCMPP